MVFKSYAAIIVLQCPIVTRDGEPRSIPLFTPFPVCGSQQLVQDGGKEEGKGSQTHFMMVGGKGGGIFLYPVAPLTKKKA